MTTNIRCKGVDLDNIFDPYVEGTSPGLTGLKVAGVDINTRYAPLIYGTAAPVTNINSKVRGTSSFVDLNTLFAAKGTAQYTLPIDGQTFVASGVAAAGHPATAHVNFNISTAGWSVVAGGTGAPDATKASGAVPSGAVDIQITESWLDATGDTNIGIVNNTCSVYTTIPGSGTVGCGVSESHSDTTGQTTHQLVIKMRNAAGTIISTTTCTFIAVTSTG